MRVAAGQFAAAEDWRANAETCDRFIGTAAGAGADLLVLPEGVLARFTDDFARIRKVAQALDGPFMEAVLRSTRGSATTVVLGIHERSAEDVVYNTLVVMRDGELVSTYRKLHLYDAFGSHESDNVTPGQVVPDLVACGDFQMGLMTCYDLRFPELARLHALRGANLLLAPAAWVRGPGKERHWDVMVTARALENTCFVVAPGECGQRNIGNSMIVDPFGVGLAQLGNRPGVCWSDLDRTVVNDARRTLPVLDNRRFNVDPTPVTHPIDVNDSTMNAVPEQDPVGR
ncbi:MAG: deaminated glutathione amidase [Nocardioidaceae bacterium]